MQAIKDAARMAIRDLADRLVRVSHKIHAEPELAFQEFRSSELLGQEAESSGFNVDFGVGGLDTAFVATAGSGGTTVGLCAEYDPLQLIDHACGHNVIAASSLGAALGLAQVARDCDLTVKLVGTPAEEVGDGAGKVLLLDQGVFDGVDFAMMVHRFSARQRRADDDGRGRL